MKEIIITALVAIFSSGGMWAFLSSVLAEKQQEKHDAQHQALQEIKDELEDIKEALKKNNQVTVAEARTTISTNCKRYRKMGYIPDDEYVAFSMLGQAYIEAKENTPVKIDFEWCMNNLERVEETE